VEPGGRRTRNPVEELDAKYEMGEELGLEAKGLRKKMSD
jgi:hypothetical protein